MQLEGHDGDDREEGEEVAEDRDDLRVPETTHGDDAEDVAHGHGLGRVGRRDGDGLCGYCVALAVELGEGLFAHGGSGRVQIRCTGWSCGLANVADLADIAGATIFRIDAGSIQSEAGRVLRPGLVCEFDKDYLLVVVDFTEFDFDDLTARCGDSAADEAGFDGQFAMSAIDEDE